MFKQLSGMFLAGALFFGAGSTGALADACSGHNHTTGTVLGAVGGGVLGGAVTHGNIGGVAGGAVLGGLAGNAISRDIDCRHRYHHARYYRHRYWSDRDHRYHYYR